MTYELAKQLKDAGFPQKNTGVFSFSYVFETDEGDLKTGEKAYCPTLSELIEACGKKFMSLRKVWDGNGVITNWIAEGDIEPVVSEIGNTPEIAVAKLWLEIK